VYLDGVSDVAVAARIEQAGWVELVKKMSDRHKGIGSDGVIVVARPDAAAAGAHVRMRMFNADGSESEMCGNGVRCVAKFAHDRLGIRNNPMLVQTGRGVLSIALQVEDGKVASATVDMGEPIFDESKIPVNLSLLKGALYAGSSQPPPHPERPFGEEQGLAGEWHAQFVSMGNPHAVIAVGDRMDGNASALDRVEVARLGPYLERHRAFPNGMNIHWWQFINPHWIAMRTWERGAGITQACGTGACATVVAGILAKRLDRDVRVDVPGGRLEIRWDKTTNHVFMTGPAVDICEGVWPDEASSKAPARIGPDRLETERLVLRPLTHEDAAMVAELANHREIAEMTLTVPVPYEVRHAHSWIATHDQQRRDGTGANMAVCEKGGRLVGVVGLNIEPAHDRAELGYWIGIPYWGRGYATEASLAMTRYGFETLGLNRIFARHYASNPASGRVLEKVGMKHEGVSPQHVKRLGAVQDSVMFGLTQADWAALRGGKG
jgi:diaminopimelate epimerase